ncbi:MAG TPA: thioredoxin family protein [Anaeromyxobacter sp.]
MANRFNVKLPVTRNPSEDEVAAVHVKELAEKDYDTEVMAALLPVVVDFYAKDSKPCEALAPRYAAVAEKFAGKVRFLRVLRQDNAALAAKLGVSGAPTVVFFKNGKELGERLSGDEIQRTALKARVEALLA